MEQKKKSLKGMKLSSENVKEFLISKIEEGSCTEDEYSLFLDIVDCGFRKAVRSNYNTYRGLKKQIQTYYFKGWK